MAVVLSAWSSQGLLAHYNSSKNRNFITLIDQTVGIGDPFYRQSLNLKETKVELAALHWNSTGSHLLVITRTGTIEIFRQTAGLINQFESIFWLKREEEKSPISLIWLENRRTFTFNSSACSNTSGTSASIAAANTLTTGTTGTTTGTTGSAAAINSPFITKVFHLNFIPSGQLSFLLISSDGSIEIFIENFGDFDIKRLQHADDRATSVVDLDVVVLKGSFAYQRPNGTVLIFLRTRNYWTISQISDNFEVEIKQKNEIFQVPEIPILKFLWSESKESLIQLEGRGQCLKMTSFNNFSPIPTTKIIDLPFEIGSEEILHSSRASNYLFLQSDNNKILILNLNGEIVKQLSLELDSFEGISASDVHDDISASDVHDGISASDVRDILSTSTLATPTATLATPTANLLISPNGLVVAKISEEFDDFPLLKYAPIGEITLKNVIMLREFLGKLISSTLNSSNSWDIFQLIRCSLQKEDCFNFISTILAEWISLLEIANIPPRDYYSKLIDLIKVLPAEFIDAYNLLDLNLRFLSIEKILLNSISINQCEEYFESIKWPESDQILIETGTEAENNLISIVPVVEEGLSLISELFEVYCKCPDDKTIFHLLPLENEIFRAIGLIFVTSKVMQKHFQFQLLKQQQHQKLSQFFDQISTSLSSKISSLETFSKFLISLRSDPQIQSKCTRNSFLFLIEFYLDSANMKKVEGHVLRIFSRYGASVDSHDADAILSKFEFFDSIKCLNLPINRNSTILICRKCHRSSTTTMQQSTKTFKSRRELIFAANWQQSLWKSRCQCGSTRRIINIQ